MSSTIDESTVENGNEIDRTETHGKVDSDSQDEDDQGTVADEIDMDSGDRVRRNTGVNAISALNARHVFRNKKPKNKKSNFDTSSESKMKLPVQGFSFKGGKGSDVIPQQNQVNTSGGDDNSVETGTTTEGTPTIAMTPTPTPTLTPTPIPTPAPTTTTTPTATTAEDQICVASIHRESGQSVKIKLMTITNRNTQQFEHRISSIEEGPAGLAGLRMGDRLVSVGGVVVEGQPSSSLLQAVKQAGNDFEIKYVRDDDFNFLDVATIVRVENEPLGVNLGTITMESNGAVLCHQVKAIQENSAADRYGLKVGDTIATIGSTPIVGLSHEQVLELIQAAREDFEVRYYRAGGSHPRTAEPSAKNFVDIPIAKAKKSWFRTKKSKEKIDVSSSKPMTSVSESSPSSVPNTTSTSTSTSSTTTSTASTSPTDGTNANGTEGDVTTTLEFFNPKYAKK